MQGLLGLLWLSPKEPNFFDRLFGKYADREATYTNQLDIALLMLGLFVLALVWRGFRRREFALEPGGPRRTLLQMIAPELDKSLAKPEFLTWANRLVTGVLLVIALLSSVNYFYGTRNNGIYVHRWDAFHTVIGVKYFEELGYTDLYKCSYAIDREGPHHFRAVKEIRDLATNNMVDRDEHISGNDCKQRFTPERLEEFRHDLDEFGTWSNKSDWKGLMKDKGFNGTPFYATVCKPLVTSIDVSIEGLKKLAVIDPILMVIAFGVVGWAFGARTAALVAILFCVFFPNRFTHMGGSILRFDYAATLLIGFSALKKDKWGLAGAMFAWATMVRVFPAIFAVGIGLKIASDVLVGGKLVLRPEHRAFFYWFGGLVLLFFLVSLVGLHGGYDNWRQWAHDMGVHNQRSASFRIGFKHLFMLDGKLTSTDYNVKQANFLARQNYYWVAAILLITPVLLSVRRLDTISFAVMFGVFGFFLFAIATRYYYGIVALLLLVDRDTLSNRFMLIMGAALFAATGFDFFYFELNDSDPLMYNIIIAVEMTLVIALVGSWLLFNPSLLDTPEMGEDPRLPTHVPAQIGARVEPVALHPAKSGKKKSAKKATDGPSDPDKRPEAEIETQTDSRPAMSPDSTERLLEAIGKEQAPPVYDPAAVTLADIELPPEVAARLAQRENESKSDDSKT
jgi:hypothetical protein